MKIGIFSGTFDPAHKGHLALANDAIAEAELDKLIFLPEATPRRKNAVTPLKQRKEMLKLIVNDNPKIDVFSGRAKSHSVEETMNELHEKYGSENNFYLVMGADVFEHIETWPSHGKLVAENLFILGLRSEDDGELAIEISERLGIKPTLVVSSYPLLSSSKIRESLKQGSQADGLSDMVLQHVQNEHLYEQQ